MQNPAVVPPDLPKIHKLVMKKSVFIALLLHSDSLVMKLPNQPGAASIFKARLPSRGLWDFPPCNAKLLQKHMSLSGQRTAQNNKRLRVGRNKHKTRRPVDPPNPRE